MENVAYIVSADTDARRVVTPKIAWYCASLLFMFAAVAAAGPLILTPVGAQTVYQAAVGLTVDISTEAYLASIAQALTEGSGMWAVPVLLWTLVALYIAVDATLVFSGWLDMGDERVKSALLRVRPVLRWAAVLAMAVLLVAGFAAFLLREGYTRYSEAWFAEESSAMPGVIAILVGGPMLPVSLAITVWLKGRAARLIRRLECASPMGNKLVRFGRMVGNGVLGSMLLAVVIAVGAYVYPMIALGLLLVAVFVSALWLTIKLLPFYLLVMLIASVSRRD